MNLAAIVDESVERYGERVLLHFEGRDFTNVALRDLGLRLAWVLREGGVEVGDRVVVLLPNCPEVPASYMAILRLGAVAIPVLFVLATPEVRHILADSGAKAVITSWEFAPRVLAAAEGLHPVPRVYCLGGDAEGAIRLEPALAEAPADPVLVDRSPEDGALLMYTSGTTGVPKGVLLTHGNLRYQADATRQLGEPDPDDVGLQCLPMAHAAGMIASVLSNLYPNPSVLLRWFSPDAFFDALRDHPVTITALVPTMMAMLLNHPRASEVGPQCTLRRVTVGAAPCPVELMQAFERHFGCEVYEVYGLTEAAPVLTANRRGQRRLGSAGLPLPGTEIAIVDPATGERLGPGATGEICARGPGIMPGYWNRPQETATAIRDGWLHTGDIGYLDADGYLYVVDRVKDMIIRGGLNIYPADVEEVLYAHPAVAECGVVGVPDPTYGEEVVAWVVLREGAEVTEEELLAHCRERLARYKAPKRVLFAPVLPKNTVGKVLRRELREMAQQALQQA